MALVVAPDVEQIVADYLRNHEDVRAVVTRVVSRTPASTETPWVRWVQIDDWDQARPANHFRGYLLQFDCYAGSDNSRETASLIARTVIAALCAMSGRTLRGATIADATASASRIPDDRVGDPPRERYIVTATVYAHGPI